VPFIKEVCVDTWFPPELDRDGYIGGPCGVVKHVWPRLKWAWVVQSGIVKPFIVGKPTPGDVAYVGNIGHATSRKEYLMKHGFVVQRLGYFVTKKKVLVDLKRISVI